MVPLSKASKKPRLTLAVAVAMMVSGIWSKAPLITATVTTKSAPMKLPRKTKSQFLRSWWSLILRLKSAMTMRLFPVKSSLPATTTIARPAVKMQAPAILPP